MNHSQNQYGNFTLAWILDCAAGSSFISQLSKRRDATTPPVRWRMP